MRAVVASLLHWLAIVLAVLGIGALPVIHGGMESYDPVTKKWSDLLGSELVRWPYLENGPSLTTVITDTPIILAIFGVIRGMFALSKRLRQ